MNLPDFNQPIEYDSKNIELRWHKIKTHLVETFKELKFEENDIINPQIMECKKYVHGKCLINYVEEELNIKNNKIYYLLLFTIKYIYNLFLNL